MHWCLYAAISAAALGRTCASPSVLAHSFFCADSPSCRGRPVSEFAYYYGESQKYESLPVPKLPEKTGCEEGAWVLRHLERCSSLSEKNFRMPSFLKRDCKEALAVYKKRRETYYRCELAYRMLLYNYCLLIDVCSRRIKNTMIGGRNLSDECYVKTAVCSYLNETFLFLGSYKDTDERYYAPTRDEAGQRYTDEFFKHYGRSDATGRLPDAAPSEAGSEDPACNGAGAARREDGQKSPSLFRRIIKMSSCISAEPGERSERYAAPVQPADSSSDSRRQKWHSMRRDSSRRQRYFKIDYVLRLFEKYEMELCRLAAPGSGDANPSDAPCYTLKFVNTSYRRILDRILDDLGNKAAAVKDSTALPES